MNSSTSYRTWIGFNDNSEGGITVYSVACYLSQGLQVDVFAFKNDAYLYLVDQAEGLTDEQRIELGLRGNAGLSPTTILPPPAQRGFTCPGHAPPQAGWSLQLR
jgi:hypothetical protein